MGEFVQDCIYISYYLYFFVFNGVHIKYCVCSILICTRIRVFFHLKTTGRFTPTVTLCSFYNRSDWKIPKSNFFNIKTSFAVMTITLAVDSIGKSCGI